MKIIVLIHEYPPIGGGGGKVAEDICTRLVKEGYSIRIITSQCGDLPVHETRDQVQIIRIPCNRQNMFGATFKNMLLFIINGFFALMREIKKKKPDVIHVHFALPSGVLGWVARKIKRIPFILTVHLGDVPGGVPEKTKNWFKWLKPFIPGIWNSASRVIAVSQYTRGLALKQYHVPIEVVPNGVELQSMNQIQCKKDDDLRIVFAGRFVAQKNPVQVIRVLGKIKDLKWQCRMLGDGPLRNEVICEINKSGLNDRIQLQGWVSPDVVQAALRESDILFLPSHSEGLPVVGVQALASGLAIVAGNIGGFTDLVEQGKNGYCLDPDDEIAMVDVMRKYCTDRELLCDTRNHSLRMVQKFDIQLVVDRYDAILREVASK